MWKKKGLIFQTSGQFEWMQTHTSVPVADQLDGSLYRLYFSPRNYQNASHIGFIELDLKNPSEILKISKEPVLIPGSIGTFDDSGVMPTCILNYGKKKYLYYIGWNQEVTVPYRNSIGLAISTDNGISFNKMYEGPIIDRTYKEPYFTASCHVLIENDIWKLWYLSCVGWSERDGIPSPNYHIKYAESTNGIDWNRKGIVCIDFKNQDEWAIARPCVIKENNIYKMWYSYRGKIPYRIGYAESENGINWNRLDNELGLDVSLDGWDSEMVEYPCVISYDDKKYLFYNGNEYGESGLGYAVLES